MKFVRDVPKNRQYIQTHSERANLKAVRPSIPSIKLKTLIIHIHAIRKKKSIVRENVVLKFSAKFREFKSFHNGLKNNSNDTLTTANCKKVRSVVRFFASSTNETKPRQQHKKDIMT